MSEELRLVTRAADFAARAHWRHRRKDVDRTPYINHLAHVARLLADAGCDANLIAAGYLHDAIEDVRVSYETLAAEFGADIADLVKAVTDNKALRWRKRKQAQIDDAGAATPRVAALKLADKISNLYSLRDTPPDGWGKAEIREYLDWAHQVVTRLPGKNAVLLTTYETIRAELVRKVR
ncbi:MAG TPA: HD domain-containing protein [Bryobacteraceae bacterium]|nr:HD domain-containing protein [Bryobacteraceae bacterium]